MKVWPGFMLPLGGQSAGATFTSHFQLLKTSNLQRDLRRYARTFSSPCLTQWPIKVLRKCFKGCRNAHGASPELLTPVRPLRRTELCDFSDWDDMPGINTRLGQASRLRPRTARRSAAAAQHLQIKGEQPVVLIQAHSRGRSSVKTQLSYDRSDCSLQM